MDELDVYEAVKDLCVTADAVTPADVTERLRSDRFDDVRAALDMLVVRGLLASADGSPATRYRPARGHEDFNV